MKLNGRINATLPLRNFRSPTDRVKCVLAQASGPSFVQAGSRFMGCGPECRSKLDCKGTHGNERRRGKADRHQCTPVFTDGHSRKNSNSDGVIIGEQLSRQIERTQWGNAVENWWENLPTDKTLGVEAGVLQGRWICMHGRDEARKTVLTSEEESDSSSTTSDSDTDILCKPIRPADKCWVCGTGNHRNLINCTDGGGGKWHRKCKLREQRRRESKVADAAVEVEKLHKRRPSSQLSHNSGAAQRHARRTDSTAAKLINKLAPTAEDMAALGGRLAENPAMQPFFDGGTESLSGRRSLEREIGALRLMLGQVSAAIATNRTAKQGGAPSRQAYQMAQQLAAAVAGSNLSIRGQVELLASVNDQFAPGSRSREFIKRAASMRDRGCIRLGCIVIVCAVQ